MKTLPIFALILLLAAVPAHAAVVTETVTYQHEGQPLQGVLAWDDAISGKRPGVLVVHEWWGLNDYVKSRVRRLAEMGYVAFAPDMYGVGKVTEHPSKAGEWMKTITENVEFWRHRPQYPYRAIQTPGNRRSALRTKYVLIIPAFEGKHLF